MSNCPVMLTNYSRLLSNWYVIYSSKRIAICRFFSAEINMFCCDQKCVGNCKQTTTSQRKAARKIKQLFCDDVVVFQLIMQGFSIFKPNHQA